MDNRTPLERLTDAALLLTLWERAVEEPRVDAGGRIWQMKLAYLFARELQERQVHGLNLNFYRWTWGPMSNQVYGVWDQLRTTGLLDEEERFLFTRRGLELADEFFGEVVCDERNLAVREAVDAVANEWKGKGPHLNAILDHVYGLPAKPVDDAEALPRPLREIREGTELLAPLERIDVREGFTVEEGWLETLAIVFNPESRAGIGAAIEDFRAGRYVVG